MSYGIGQECHGATMDSCSPWTPRHCADCGACEAVTGFVYDRRPQPGYEHKPLPTPKPHELVCWDCLQAQRRGLGL